MADMTYEDIERIWHSINLYLPDKNKSDAAVEFINTLKDIGVDEAEIKASSDCFLEASALISFIAKSRL